MTGTQPFDTDLHDSVMAARPNFTDEMTVHECAIWYGGYLNAAGKAARLSAERHGTMAYATHDEVIRSLIEETEMDGFDSYDLDREETRRFLSFYLVNKATERAGAVSDEELRLTLIDILFPALLGEDTKLAYGDDPGIDDHIESTAERVEHAVRAALAPPLPVVPDGWDVSTITRVEFAKWEARLSSLPDPSGPRVVVSATGPTWLSALSNAITAAQEEE